MYSVLIADDEQLIRNGLARSIPWADLGFRLAGTAASTEEAIAVFKSGPVALLITDISMPGKDGLELIDWVNRNSPETRKIVISGYDRFDYALGALKSGAKDYILKPIKKQEIISAVSRIAKELDEFFLLEKENEKTARFVRGYFLRKLLDNSFVSSEELKEIRQRLELSGETAAKYQVTVVDTYGSEPYQEPYIRALAPFRVDDIGSLLVVITLESETAAVHRLAEEAIEKKLIPPLPRESGSSQRLENLCISYDSALGKMTNREQEQVHAFRATHSEHRELITLMDLISMGTNEKTESMVLGKFTTFENTASGKRWCVWFMDRLEENFKSYKFTGKYQQAVKDFPRNPEENSLETLRECFMQYLKKVFMTFDEKKQSGTAATVSRAKELISRNFQDKNFSLSAAAESLRVSYGYLSGIFKQETGSGFTDYLTEVRMKKAADLISAGDIRIYEAADRCGYTNYRYFTDIFKKYWGVPPSEYKPAAERRP
ncbi:response regulator transcription factor [Breznakiella homolactica]|uniref:Response regulator n=1 Tax=Breznakiella homolactica TaxID=2798577 RepID=A0A7T8BBN0_9SPIR|nr:response regulator [Breznakiella homolactica]QQO09378.1 response regulator [Breznakiella homolactica]